MTRRRPAGPLRTRIIQTDAIFFDFDGVLVESIKIKADAFMMLYAEFGAQVVRRVMEHHRAHEGISRLEKIRHCHKEILGVELTERDLAALARRYSSLVEDAVVTCDWVAGAQAFLDAARVPLFVVSGTPEPELRRVIELRGMTRYFRGVYGSPRGKGAIVAELLAEGKFDPPGCLFVGDAMADLEAAQANRVPFIGRVPEGRANPFPEGTRIITDLSELTP